MKWTETSQWDELRFKFGENVGLFALFDLLGTEGAKPNSLTIQRQYVDTINWGIGFEYRYNPRLDLRFGYEPRKSGIPENTRDFLIPLGDMDVIAVGFSYLISPQSSFDLTFGYTQSKEFIKAGTSINGNNSDDPVGFILNPTAGLDTLSTLEAILIEMSYRTVF